MTRNAVCCCGDCFITVEGEPVLNAICHCSSCKKRTGSAFGWSAYFADDKIVGTRGTLNVYGKEGETGYNRYFCARCGTTLYWKSFSFLSDHVGVAGGCFAENPLPAPAFSSFEVNRCVWVGLPADWQRAL